jgi:hypothetical protein
MPALSTLIFALFLLPLTMARAADDPHAEDRKELLKVFREIEAAINAQSVDRMVMQMAPDATVTVAQRRSVARARRDQGLLRAHGQGREADPRQVHDAAKVSAPARFFGGGEVAVADGTTEDEFFPVARGPFRLSSNWTSTSAKIDGQWKVVGLHLSSNVFTNPLMDEGKVRSMVHREGASRRVRAGLPLGSLAPAHEGTYFAHA